jgi:hypothetical protein
MMPTIPDIIATVLSGAIATSPYFTSGGFSIHEHTLGRAGYRRNKIR